MHIDYQTLGKVIRLSYRPSTLTWRRFLWANSFLTAYGATQAFNGLSSILDMPLKSTLDAQAIGAPIYIVSVPRSGTTFLHRLMALDQQFTTLKLYQSIMPSVSVESLAKGLRNMAGKHKEIAQIGQGIDRLFSGWDAQHHMGINKDEEDEGLWTMAMAAPSLWLLCPFPDDLDSLKYIDHWPEERRTKLAEHFAHSLKKHMYACAEPGQTLLMKSVFVSSRLNVLRQATPEARFVHLVRHPYDEIPSTISMFTVPWRAHSPEIPQDSKRYRAWADLVIDYSLRLHREKIRINNDTFITIKYSDLVRDPAAQIKTIYEKLNLEMTPQYQADLTDALQVQRNHKSNHKYTLEQFGLEKEYIYERLAEMFDAYDFAP